MQIQKQLNVFVLIKLEKCNSKDTNGLYTLLYFFSELFLPNGLATCIFPQYIYIISLKLSKTIRVMHSAYTIKKIILHLILSCYEIHFIFHCQKVQYQCPLVRYCLIVGLLTISVLSGFGHVFLVYYDWYKSIAARAVYPSVAFDSLHVVCAISDSTLQLSTVGGYFW